MGGGSLRPGGVFRGMGNRGMAGEGVEEEDGAGKGEELEDRKRLEGERKWFWGGEEQVAGKPSWHPPSCLPRAPFCGSGESVILNLTEGFRDGAVQFRVVWGLERP